MPITKTPTVGCDHRLCSDCATIYRHNQRFSKRKFNDYSSASDDEDDEFITLFNVRMKKDTKTTSTRLQFFVRMMPEGNSIVIRASADETVKSVHKMIWRKTGIPVPFQRLIYNGKQLQLEQSLGECSIQNDSNLQLVGHLRSLTCPRAWEAMDDTVSLIHRLCLGESASMQDAILALQCYITMHFDKAEYITVFMSLNIPSVLVTLYVSPYPGNKTIADSTFRHIMSCCLAASCRTLQMRCLDVVLAFCKLFRRISCDDALYHICRVGFGILLKKVGGICIWYPEWWVLFQGVFSFVRELADRLLWDLDSHVNCPAFEKLLLNDVRDFTDFSVLLRNVIREQQALEGAVVHEQYYREEGAGVVDRFRVVYIQLLSKMDECLHGMEGFLANKEQGKEDEVAIHLGWSQYLSILKELYEISKLYDGAEEEFWRVLLRRRNMLSQLIVRYAAESSDDHRWILERRSVTNFESRRVLAMKLFPVVHDDYGGQFHEMLINRSHLLVESFEYIARARPESLHGVLFVVFKNEDASGPGVVREWFLLVCQALFNPQTGLFVACPNDRRRIFPSSASEEHTLHLEYFVFSGRIIALALRIRVQLGIVLDRVFFMQLAGKRITLEDIRDADPYMYNSCKEILQMDADFVDSDALGLVFVRDVVKSGQKTEIELCPGGKNLVVNSKNREKYVDLLIQDCFVTSISEQVSHFAKGFGDIISSSKMQQFFQTLDPEDLDWMLRGSEKGISVEDWKAHTKYKGYQETDCQISWFWEVVGRLPAQQRNVLLFFWTSLRYLPVEGFRGLDFPLSICKVMEPDDRLPSSHTCFYQLCFPAYSSKAIMQNRILTVTREYIGCSFGIP